MRFSLRRMLAFLLVFAALLVSNGLVLAQQENAGNASATEIAFWNSVKDSQDPEEIKAYLDVFPQGAFSSLARIRIKNLEQKRQSAGSATKGRPAPMDEPAIRDVQERLYNLNYAITAINGKLTTETAAAVRVLQGRLGEAATGELTEAQIAKLRGIEPPKIWGAIAGSANGSIETIWKVTSRREAEAKMLLACSTKGNAECKVFAITGRQCAAAASYREATDGKVAASITISRQVGMGPAQIAALATCNKDPKSQGRCQIVSKVCADGSHLSATAPQREGGLPGIHAFR